MLTVLAYHSVSSKVMPAIGPEYQFGITPNDLQARLVGRGRDVLAAPCEALFKRRQSSRLLLTFDDGYFDFIAEALPVLESLDAPAMIFVVPGYANGDVLPLEPTLARILDEASVEGASQEYAALRRELACLEPEVQREQLEACAVRYGKELASCVPRMLSWSEILELDRHPLVTVGSHTMTHRPLDQIGVEDACGELRRSKAALEDVLGHSVWSCSYPFGRSSRAVRVAAKHVGYTVAFGTKKRRVIHPLLTDMMNLPRLCHMRKR